MSMPLSSACSPLALEIISGRLPCAAGVRFERAAGLPFECDRPNNLPALATALPASEVRKNLRRDHSSIGSPSSVFAGQYTSVASSQWRDEPVWWGGATAAIRTPSATLAGTGGLCGEFTFPARNHHARDTIPEYSDRRSPHIHQLINRE